MKLSGMSGQYRIDTEHIAQSNQDGLLVTTLGIKIYSIGLLLLEEDA
jgi:hypothetical protein